MFVTSNAEKEIAARLLCEQMLGGLQMEVRNGAYTAFVSSVPEEVVEEAAQQLHEAGWVCQYGLSRPCALDYSFPAMRVMSVSAYIQRQRRSVSAAVSRPFIAALLSLIPISLIAIKTQWIWTMYFVAVASFALAAWISLSRKAALPERLASIVRPEAPVQKRIPSGNWCTQVVRLPGQSGTAVQEPSCGNDYDILIC